MGLSEDPLDEEGDIPLGGPRTIVHRYPDRVLFLVSNECAMYCRFCTRKRKVGDERKNPSMEEIRKGIECVASHEDIRDVLVSGGDPLLISNSRLDEILGKLREIKHLELIRIGTRVPCVWPQKIIEDTELVEVTLCVVSAFWSVAAAMVAVIAVSMIIENSIANFFV